VADDAEHEEYAKDKEAKPPLGETGTECHDGFSYRLPDPVTATSKLTNAAWRMQSSQGLSISQRCQQDGGAKAIGLWSNRFHPNVRFGSKADIRVAKSHVRFTPESGHQNNAIGMSDKGQ
jgi:hypothetical protein